MKKIFLLAAGTFVFATFTQAQSVQDSTKTKKEWKKGNRSSFQKLDLTDSQKQQLKKIRDDSKAQRTTIQSDQTLSADQKSQRLKVLRQSQKEKMDAVFTPEQKQQMQTFQYNRQHMKGRRNGAMKNRKGNPMASLNLTPDQKDQMKKIRQDNMAQRQAIKKDSSLTDDQKMEKMKELNTSMRSQLNSILTKEQKNDLRSDWKKNRMKIKSPDTTSAIQKQA